MLNARPYRTVYFNGATYDLWKAVPAANERATIAIWQGLGATADNSCKCEFVLA